MAGKYIKARQLAKEIEKKAKKTAEKKEKAKEGIERVEEFVEESKKLGADVEFVRGVIEEAKVKIDNRMFDDALDKIETAIDQIREANRENVEDIIHQIDELHSFMDKSKMENLSSKVKLSKVHEHLENDDFEKAVNTAKDALKDARKEVDKELDNQISEYRDLLDTINDIGSDYSKYESTLRQLEGYRDKEEFKNAFEDLSRSYSEMNNELKNFIKNKIERIEEEETILRKHGGDTQEIEEFISKIKVRIGEEDIKGAFYLLKKTEKKLNEISKTIISKLKNNLEKDIQEAKELDISNSMIEKIENKLKNVEDSDQVLHQYEILNSIIDELDEIKFKKVLKTIAKSRENFVKAKDLGIDINEPMNLLNEARSCLKGGKHKEALKWADRGKNRIKDLVSEYEKIEERLRKLKEDYERLQDFDLHFEGVENLFNECEQHLKNKEYDQAKEKLDDIEDLFDEKASDKVIELIEELEFNLLNAETMGLDLDKYSEFLRKAISRTKENDYIDAGQTALEGIKKVKLDIENRLNSKIESLTNILEKSKDHVSDLDKSELATVKRMIEHSRSRLEEGNYKESHELIVDSENQVKDWQIGQANKSLSQAKEYLDFCENINVKNINLQRYRKRLSEAERELDNGNYSESISKSKSIIEEMNTLLEGKVNEYFNESKIEVVKAKKTGVPIDEMRDKLIKCKKDIRKENFKDAIKICVDVKTQAVDFFEKQKKINDRKEKIKEQLEPFKKKADEADVNSVINLLDDVDEFSTKTDYEKANELLDEASQKLEEIDKKINFELMVEKVEGILFKAKEISVDVEDIEKEIEETKKIATEESEYRKASKKLKEINEIIEYKIRHSILPKIKETKEIIKSAKNIGIKIDDQEKMLKDAETLFEEENYVTAVKKIMECQEQIEYICNQSKKAAEKIKEIKESIREAEDLNADVKDAKEKLKDAMQSLKSDEFDKAIEISRRIKKLIENAKDNRVENILSEFGFKIKDVEKEGVDTSLAKELFEEAEEAKYEGRHKEAINLAMQGERELERIELQQDIASRSILTISKKLDRTKEMGIPLPEIERLLKEANDAFRSGLYVKAFDKAVKAGGELNDIFSIYNKSEQLIDELKEILEKSDKFGIKTKAMEKVIYDAEDKFKNNNYLEAYSQAQKGLSNFEELTDKTKDLVEKEEQRILSLKEKGKDIRDAINLINKAKANLDFGNLLEVFELLEEVRDEYISEDKKLLEKKVRDAVKLVEKAKKFGSPMYDVEKLIEEVKEIKDKDIQKSIEKINTVLIKIENILESHSPQIKLDIKGHLRPEKWNEIEIHFKNIGGSVANDPKIDIEGGKMEPIDLPDKLGVNKNVTVKTKIKPNEDTIKLIAKTSRIFDNKKIENTYEKKVIIRGFLQKRANGGEQCAFCNGKLKEGMKMIECECGSIYHTPCAKRNGECLKCKTQFKEI